MGAVFPLRPMIRSLDRVMTGGLSPARDAVDGPLPSKKGSATRPATEPSKSSANTGAKDASRRRARVSRARSQGLRKDGGRDAETVRDRGRVGQLLFTKLCATAQDEEAYIVTSYRSRLSLSRTQQRASRKTLALDESLVPTNDVAEYEDAPARQQDSAS